MNELLSGRRILVVEDEILLSLTIEDMLADFGCESAAATTSEMAVALVEGQVFDAAVLDMSLNGESSRTVADALAARGVPFVVTTGNRVTWDGFRDHAVLRKPFKYAELADVLTRLLPH
jgi:CheY-like chemotaxis protein